MEEIIRGVRELFGERRKIKYADLETSHGKSSNIDDESLIKGEKKRLNDEFERDKKRDKDKIKKAYDLITNYWQSMEPPKQDEANFMLFLQGQKRCFRFCFEDDKLVKRTIGLSEDDKTILSGEGFKIIQTPHSNRIFLIGGDDHPYSTYEFDLKTNEFLTAIDDDENYRIFVPLGIGRSHHSLAATSGMIF